MILPCVGTRKGRLRYVNDQFSPPDAIVTNQDGTFSLGEQHKKMAGALSMSSPNQVFRSRDDIQKYVEAEDKTLRSSDAVNTLISGHDDFENKETEMENDAESQSDMANNIKSILDSMNTSLPKMADALVRIGDTLGRSL